MNDYQDEYDAIADLDEDMRNAFDSMDDEDKLAYLMKDCDCGNCNECRMISDRDFY